MVVVVKEEKKEVGKIRIFHQDYDSSDCLWDRRLRGPQPPRSVSPRCSQPPPPGDGQPASYSFFVVGLPLSATFSHEEVSDFAAD